MNKDMKNKLIESLKKYADIPNEELNWLMNKIQSSIKKKDDFFLHQGDHSSKMAYIFSGLFRVYCIDIAGNEKTLSFRRDGQFLSGYSPSIERKDIWYSIQALEDSQILYMNFIDFKELESQHPCWNEVVKNYVTELFIEKEDRERSLLLEDAMTRYSHFKRKYPDFESRIPQYHIASYLGITASSLSRIKSMIKKL